VSPSTQPPSSGPSTPTGPVDQAKADLARRLAVPVAEVRLVSSTEVTWPDSSLGCPEPGMHYAQVLTNGTRIILSAAGKQYEYHSGPRRAPFLCENPR
jgi:hypothetical protein